MNDIRNCYLPEIPADFDRSAVGFAQPCAPSSQSLDGRRNLIILAIVLSFTIGAGLYLHFASLKLNDEKAS